jgi:ribosome maturation factor RimP
MQLAEKITHLANEFLKEGEVFLVGVKISQGNRKILVVIDGDKGVGIDDCTKLSRYLSEELENEESLQAAYHLDVTSAGADEPLLLRRQYPQHIGRKLQVKLDDGELIKGRLKEMDKEYLVLEEQQKKKEANLHKISFDEIKEARVILEF